MAPTEPVRLNPRLLPEKACPRDGCEEVHYAPFLEVHLAFDHDEPPRGAL